MPEWPQPRNTRSTRKRNGRILDSGRTHRARAEGFAKRVQEPGTFGTQSYAYLIALNLGDQTYIIHFSYLGGASLVNLPAHRAGHSAAFS